MIVNEITMSKVDVSHGGVVMIQQRNILIDANNFILLVVFRSHVFFYSNLKVI